MAIVCGTDFSRGAWAAVEVAAHLAARMNLPLHLVHAIDVSEAERLDEPGLSVARRADDWLHREAERLRRVTSKVQVHLMSGTPAEAVVEMAASVEADLIVVAARGDAIAGRPLGGQADRVAQQSHQPVLVVRDPVPIEAWTRGERPLKLLLAADFAAGALRAPQWVSQLARLGPCELVAVRLYSTEEERERLGISGTHTDIGPHSLVVAALERDLRAHLGDLGSNVSVRLRLVDRLDDVAAQLVAVAAEEHADLIVMGSRGRHGAEHLWARSVSHGVLRAATCSVACVPEPSPLPLVIRPHIQTVLAATDFSPIGNAGVALARAIIPDNGVVHIVHVVGTHGGDERVRDIFEADEASALNGRLERLGWAAGITSPVTHVLASDDPAKAIAQAAERLNVDVVCIGTHGRTGVGRFLLGSVAQGVLSATRRPVLLARS